LRKLENQHAKLRAKQLDGVCNRTFSYSDMKNDIPANSWRWLSVLIAVMHFSYSLQLCCPRNLSLASTRRRVT